MSSVVADSQDAIDCLCSIFGASFYTGVRGPFPRINKAPSQLRENDNINIFSCSNESSVNCIRFSYDAFDCQVSVKIDYYHIAVNSDPNVIRSSLLLYLSQSITQVWQAEEHRW